MSTIKCSRLLAALGVVALASEGAVAEVCNPNQPLSGAALFHDHCAVCHGETAEGGRAPSGVSAPDLTALAGRRNGRFPAQDVARIIRYGGWRPDHAGEGQMPIWAKIFFVECGPEYSRQVVVELMKYVESVQK